ncbi:MAG: hypothetical protein J5879_04395, partial [Clostridia bacterium]|nr:hypothetical protein [Clostridia bacterium]
IPAAMAAGVASGFITAFLQTRMGINSLLSGIIVNTGLYSVNIAVMGGASLLNMNKAATVFSDAKSFLLDILMPFCNRIEGALAGAAAKLFRLGDAEEVRAGVTAATGKVFDFIAGWHKVIVAFIFVALTVIFISIFLKTRLGLAIRATGDNTEMVRYSSINPVFTTTVGLCVANAFTALSGCLLAQSQKSAEINMGQGMVTVALASLLIGGTLFSRGSIRVRAIGAVVGGVIFRLVYAVALRFQMPAYMLKLVSAVIVIFAIFIPYLKKQYPALSKKLFKRKEA